MTDTDAPAPSSGAPADAPADDASPFIALAHETTMWDVTLSKAVVVDGQWLSPKLGARVSDAGKAEIQRQGALKDAVAAPL